MFKKGVVAKTTVEAPGQRDKVDKCQICERGFNLMLKQHQCKRCLRAVCSECGKEKAITFHFDLNVKHRMCKICRAEQIEIQNLITNVFNISSIFYQNRLKFAQNSFISEKWLNFFLEPDQSQKEKEVYEHYRDLQQQYFKDTQSRKNSLLGAKNSFQEAFQNILDGFHYSLWELNYLLTNQLKKEYVIEMVKDVIQIFLYTHPKIKFQSVVDEKNLIITLFLLYFNEPAYTYYFLTFIYDIYLPERFSEEQEIDSQPHEQEVDFLIQIAQKNHLIETVDLLYVRKFLENYSNFFLSHLLTTILNVPSILFHYDMIFNHQDVLIIQSNKFKFYESEKLLLSIIQINLKAIKQKLNDRAFLVRYLLNNTQASKLKNNFCREDRMKFQSIKSKLPIPCKSDDIFRNFSEGRSGSIATNNFYSSMPTSSSSKEASQNESEIGLCITLLEKALNGNIDKLEIEKFNNHLSTEEQKQFSHFTELLGQINIQNNIQKSLIKKKLSDIKEEDSIILQSLEVKQKNSFEQTQNELYFTAAQIQPIQQEQQSSEQNDIQGGNSNEQIEQLKKEIVKKDNIIQEINKKLDKEQTLIKKNQKYITDLESKNFDLQQQTAQKDFMIKEIDMLVQSLNLKFQKQQQTYEQEISSKQKQINDLELQMEKLKEEQSEKLTQISQRQQEQVMKLMKDFGMVDPPPTKQIQFSSQVQTNLNNSNEDISKFRSITMIQSNNIQTNGPQPESQKIQSQKSMIISSSPEKNQTKKPNQQPQPPQETKKTQDNQGKDCSIF